MRLPLAIFLIILLSTSIASAINAPQLTELERENLRITEKLDRARKKNSKKLTRGKGTWVNVWNYPKNINAFVNRLDKFDIDTIYLQINRSTTEIFKHQKSVDAILKAAHKKDIKVIGWTYCYLRDIKTDAKKFIEPALYISPQGERLDGMAADIEENTALWAVTSYTEKIKAELPRDYPLIAIVYSPKIKTRYPWEYMANNWDVLMPMTYWHGLKKRNNDTVYNFVRDSIVQLRKLTGKDDLNIHMITDGDRTSSKEVEISLKAAKDLNVNAGVSVYPEHLATDEMLGELKSF